MGDSVGTVVDSLAADRAAFLAGDGDAGDETVEAKDAPKPPVDEDADDDVDSDKVEAAADDDDDLDEDDDDEPDDSLDDDDDEDDAGDPQLKKRLSQVRRFEQRSRERIAQERAQLAREVEAVKPRLEKLERFERLATRAKYEPAAVLRELGLSEDDFEDAARELYANSTKGSADPKNKEAVLRSKRERELADKLSTVEKRLAEREEQERQAQMQREANEQAERYVRSVAKKIDPEQHPLAARQRAKNPTKLQARLSEVAYEIAQKTGSVPKPERVLARYEKIRRAELEELGIDIPTKTTTKTGEKTTAKGAKPEPKVNGASRDEIVRELMAGDFD